ncbi:hypothetical protein RM780_22565 [Streptomyces sp. DSM 44917]|uniref:Uncharacterized protein n=1 Tax=Streptomyces boetiae TaxID=3075541 RepID=A0ABU2LE02_9ACTN|nr:hypothetical protein [Streptomyces sp. DSM 44917]MDT0309720.1 hypothetical protein [Streptomyces sp. DSM 44917]
MATTNEGGCRVPDGHDPAVIETVLRVCRDVRANEKVTLAAFETGWVESHMNNLDCGDEDSVGVFQQRPSQGWGSVEECRDIEHATRSFLERAVPAERDNPEHSAGRIAQTVQRSAYPGRYDDAEGKARALIEEAERRLS